MAEVQSNEFLTYKGKPLVRNDKMIYYGDMADSHVCMLQIMTTKDSDSIELSDSIMIQLVLTDPSVSPMDRIVKKATKQGIFNAMEIASIWLLKALKGE